MTEAEFRGELKNLKGGYVLFGKEDYLKLSYAKEVQKNVLDGMFDEFNHIVIYGEEYSAGALLDAICTFPMMSEKKLVELRGVNFNGLKKDEIKAFENALMTVSENSDHTVLLIRADSSCFNEGRLPQKPSELYRIMAKYLTMVEFDFPTPQRLKGWILKHFQSHGVKFSEDLSTRLVDVCGHDMWALSNEIEKLCSYAQMNRLEYVTEEIIENVCCKTVEYDDFRLTNALLDKNKDLVFETLRRQKLNHEKPAAILSSIIRLYMEMYLVSAHMQAGLNKSQIAKATSIHEFTVGKYINAITGVNPKKIERAVELCRDADISSKSATNVTDYIAVDRLVSALAILFCK